MFNTYLMIYIIFSDDQNLNPLVAFIMKEK